MKIIFTRKKRKCNITLRLLFLVILIAIRHHSAFPYPQLLNQRYIIDTDCGTDDFCALNLLLSRPEIEISAVVVSEGTLEPQDGIKKVKSLLDDWRKQTIHVFATLPA